MVEARNNTSSPIISTSAEQFVPPQELVNQLERAMKSSCVKQIDAVVELPPHVSVEYQETLLDILNKETEVGYDLSKGYGGAFLLTLSKVKPYLKRVTSIEPTKFISGVHD